MRIRTHFLLAAAAFSALLMHAAMAGNVTLKVGPKAPYQTISAAVSFADSKTNPNDYFIIDVAPGTYTNDFPQVTRPMTIQTAAIGRPVVLNATELLPNEKGIILNLSNLTVNGLTFQGATISNGLGGNGAGIRDQNVSTANPYLIVINSTFVNNQEGILTGYNSAQSITITNSTFKNNGNPDIGHFQHALYVNYAGSLTVTGSMFCGQLIGHDIKSRALSTTVSNNRLYDGQADPVVGCRAGTTSYAIDLPNGGVASISGNLITQGAASPNSIMVSYGEEGLMTSTNSVMVSNNTFTNIGTLPATGIFQQPQCVPVKLTGNRFTGVATPVEPASCAVYK
jgi:hypothetical protein